MRMSKTRAAALVLALASPAATALFYGRLPAEIPTNWGLDGAVSYSPRGAIWLMAALPAVLWLLMAVTPRLDPRRENYRKFQGFYDGFMAALMLFFLGLTLLTISESLHPGRISVGAAVPGAMGVLFVFIGNQMPKLRSNFFMGFKNPWTLSSTEVWNRTHRLAGYLWFAGGVVVVLLTVFVRSQTALFAAFLAVLLVMVLVPTVCSYLWFRREQSGRKL